MGVEPVACLKRRLNVRSTRPDSSRAPATTSARSKLFSIQCCAARIGASRWGVGRHNKAYGVWISNPWWAIWACWTQGGSRVTGPINLHPSIQVFGFSGSILRSSATFTSGVQNPSAWPPTSGTASRPLETTRLAGMGIMIEVFAHGTSCAIRYRNTLGRYCITALQCTSSATNNSTSTHLTLDIAPFATSGISPSRPMA